MKLLAIFAHPDDEAFSCGGTLARYAAQGIAVHLVCATRGEEGEINHPDIDPTIPKGPERGTLRQGELEDACRALGIESPTFLDYHDSGFPIEVGRQNPAAFMNADLALVERQLLKSIAAIRPEVMLTFDPHGGYGHIDHLMIHRAASAAFWAAGAVMRPAPRRLFFPARTIAQVEARNANWDHWKDPKIFGVSADSFAAIIENGAYAERKKTALAAHRSQVGSLERVEAMASTWGEGFTRETFILGGVRGTFPEAPVDDLFAGL